MLIYGFMANCFSIIGTGFELQYRFSFKLKYVTIYVYKLVNNNYHTPEEQLGGYLQTVNMMPP